jgi:hypothetical protein
VDHEASAHSDQPSLFIGKIIIEQNSSFDATREFIIGVFKPLVHVDSSREGKLLLLNCSGAMGVAAFVF